MNAFAGMVLLKSVKIGVKWRVVEEAQVTQLGCASTRLLLPFTASLQCAAT